MGSVTNVPRAEKAALLERLADAQRLAELGAVHAEEQRKIVNWLVAKGRPATHAETVLHRRIAHGT